MALAPILGKLFLSSVLCIGDSPCVSLPHVELRQGELGVTVASLALGVDYAKPGFVLLAVVSCHLLICEGIIIILNW